MGEVKRMMWSCMCVRVVICRCEEDDVEMRVTARRKEGGRKAEEGGRRRTEGGGRDCGMADKKLEPHTEMWGIIFLLYLWLLF